MRASPKFFLLVTAIAAAQSSLTQDPVIEAARRHAATFAQSLPDYIVTRTTTRYQGSGDRIRDLNASHHYPSVKVDKWRTLDTVSGEVAVEGGKEIYSNIKVNGKPAKALPTRGVWSHGEFATLMQQILSPERNALFTNMRPGIRVNRVSYRYDFEIDQAHSAWYLDAALPGKPPLKVTPAYVGAIWLDRETSQVLRIEESARDIPGNFPLDLAEAATDYDFVKIGDGTYLLPTHTETVTCERFGSACFRNETVFQDYSKFAANTSISFDGASK